MASVFDSMKVWADYPNPARLEQLQRRREFIEEQARTHPAAAQLRDTVARSYPKWQPVVDTLARGCVLVELKLWDDGSWLQAEIADVIRYNEYQNERAEHKGQCDGGCSVDKLTETPSGGHVCRQTWTPCQSHELREALRLVRLINPRPKKD